MIYPGDNYTFLLSITTSTGAAPSITAAPAITIVSLSTNTAVLTGQSMTAIAGTSSQVYSYTWQTSGLTDGEYIALVSYAHDGITVNSQLLEKLKLGDSRIIAVVAQDSSVAKDSTVAKDASVAHLSDLATISPDQSPTIAAIKAKTDLLPNDPASATLVNSILLEIIDIHNAVLGTWIIDKTQTPQVLTFFNADNSVLARFQLSDNPSSTNRTKL